MLRGENVACGTTSTGQGTLTCAAPPSGFVDLYTYLTSLGYGNGDIVICPLTIKEYTSALFTTESQGEVGYYLVTLGANLAGTTISEVSTGIGNRTPIQASTGGSNYDDTSPTPISIGTAANTLIFFGASAIHSAPAFPPYVDTPSGGFPGYVSPFFGINTPVSTANVTSGLDYYFPWYLPQPAPVKTGKVRVTTAYTGGTPVSNGRMAIYQIAPNGRAGRRLLDLGAFSAGVAFNSTGVIVTGNTTPMLIQGAFFVNFCGVWSGGTGGPGFLGISSWASHGILGLNANAVPIGYTSATGGSASTPSPNPANVVGWGSPSLTPLWQVLCP